MSGSVDKIERVALAVESVVHLDGVALDGDASLTLELHIVEHLGLKVFSGHGIGIFKKTVGKGAFAVVNMRDYAEIADILHQCTDYSGCKVT